MLNGRLVKLVAPIAALSLTGCGGGAAEVLDGYKEAKLESREDLKEWSGSASAPTIFFFSLMPLFIVDLSQQVGEDTSCPVITTEGSKKIYKGGCTDKAGTRWVGTASSEDFNREKQAVGAVRYEGFGFEKTDSCGGQSVSTSLKFEGEIKGKNTKPSEGTFDINIRMDGTWLKDDCSVRTGTLAFDYQAKTEETSNSKKWNGEGVIGSSFQGKLQVSTVDQVFNESCNREAASGKTTLKSGKNTVVVTYDGATDCDEDSTARWSLNGQDQGEMAGIGCSAGGGAGLAWGAVAALLALLPRRRRR